MDEKEKLRPHTVITFSSVPCEMAALERQWSKYRAAVFQYNLAIMPAFDALCPLRAFLIAAFFYAERKESILRSNRLSTGLHVGNFSNVRVSEASERPKVFHGLELTDRFSYGPLLLQPRHNATSFRATPSSGSA